MYHQWRCWLLFLSPVLTMTTAIAPHNYAPTHEYKPLDYSFSYGVKDLHTGDVKQQWEKKNGQIVTGHYSVLEPDGSLRSVDYTAGGKNGFNAVVKHDIPGHHPSIKEDLPPLSHSELIIKSEEQDYNSLHQDKVEQQPQYLYLKQEPEQTVHQEALNTNIKVISPNNYLQTIIGKPAIRYQQQSEIVKTPLPVDINILKETTEKIIPIDVSLLNPIEIDLHDQKEPEEQHYSLEESHAKPEQDELAKFFQQYYGQSKLNEPLLETGFKPIITKPSSPVVTQTNSPIPNTFKSYKKPVTTPGLKNYASSRNKLARSRDYFNTRPYYRIDSQPVRFMRRSENGQNSRTYGSNKNFIKYKKRVTTYDV